MDMFGHCAYDGFYLRLQDVLTFSVGPVNIEHLFRVARDCEIFVFTLFAVAISSRDDVPQKAILDIGGKWGHFFHTQYSTSRNEELVVGWVIPAAGRSYKGTDHTPRTSQLAYETRSPSWRLPFSVPVITYQAHNDKKVQDITGKSSFQSAQGNRECDSRGQRTEQPAWPAPKLQPAPIASGVVAFGGDDLRYQGASQCEGCSDKGPRDVVLTFRGLNVGFLRCYETLPLFTALFDWGNTGTDDLRAT
ncbi:hypothetical protein CERSUDRAFT_76378 [Gelatoporia subvermispora B]|uniref:Uncharacterized protein n=1 Tax=Ceriporiopsis subvermispora (strain B) TaxID=914234 RepID=M2PD31_CERS8|nr:hypothetical protein CERSUDRAFT_76378 [Gelatoporia subvermispora B]